MAILRPLVRREAISIVSLALTLLTLAAWTASVPARVQGADPTGMFFYDSEIGDPLASGTAGLVTGTGFTFTASDWGSIFIRSTTDAFPWWQIAARGPGDAPLVAGRTYTAADWSSEDGARLLVSGSSGQCTIQSGSFTVHDVAYEGSAYSRLSMSFSLTCYPANAYAGSFAGELRYQTSAPAFQAVAQAPEPAYKNFDARRVGQVTLARTWTLQNVGSGPLSIGRGTMGGPAPSEFQFVDDGCSDTTLAVGASCTFGTRFAPTRGGSHEAIAILPVDTPLGNRQVLLRGDGFQPTATTLEVTGGWHWGPVELTARVTPNPVNAGYAACVRFYFPDDPDTYACERPDQDGVARMWQMFKPGEHRVYAEYRPDTFYAPSRSQTSMFLVGETTYIALSSDRDPATPPQRPTLTARLYSTATPYDGGVMTLEDVTTGAVLDRLDVTAGQQVLRVQPELSVGPHVIRASYSGHGVHGASSAELTQDMRLQAVATIGPETVYPYDDGYLDEVQVYGSREVPASVRVVITRLLTGETVFDESIAAATGDYRIAWPGTVGGELAPEGAYGVAVSLDGGGTAPTVVEGRVRVSHDWVSWVEKSVTLPGKSFWRFGRSRDAVVSTSGSSYAGGVRLSSGRGMASVVYEFPLAGARIYGQMRFDVQGASPDRHQALLAIWNPKLGSATDLEHYDAAVAAGPGNAWWSASTDGTGRRKDGVARATVMTWRGLGGAGAATFDIRRVRFTYRVGTLHDASTTVEALPDPGPEVVSADPDASVARPVEAIIPVRLMPGLQPAADLDPDVEPAAGPASTLYYQGEPDAPVGKAGTVYLTSDEATFLSATQISTPTSSITFAFGGSGQPIGAGETYTDGSVRIFDRVWHWQTCPMSESAFTVHDIQRDETGATTLLSLTARWTCLDDVTLEPTGSFAAELRYNTATPTFGGLLQEPLVSDSRVTGSSVRLASAAVGSQSDTRMTFTAVGTRPTTVGPVSVSGPQASVISIVNDGCSDRTLAVGARCTLDVRFRPTVRGRREALVTIPLDTAFGKREFWVNGWGQHPTTTTLDVPKGPHTKPFAVGATVQPMPDDLDGSWCMTFHVEGPATRSPTSSPCGPGGEAGFSMGEPSGLWTIWAESTETRGYASSRSPRVAVRIVEEPSDWATGWVQAGPFYPVRDGFRDTIAIYGNRKFPIAVDVTITSLETGMVVATHTIPAAASTYHWGWDGTADDGSGIVPAGTYRIDAVLSEGPANERTITRDVKLSQQWVEWTTRSVTLRGDQYTLWGTSGGAAISPSGSAYPTGVRLTSGKGAAVVEYAFPVARSSVYGPLTVAVSGRSTNRHQALVAVWNPGLGSYRYLSSFDAAVAIGPGYQWWNARTSGDGRIRDGKARATVMVAEGLGRVGSSTFDIRSVKLTYTVGELQAAASSVGDPLQDVAPAGAGGRADGARITRRVLGGVLPLLRDADLPPEPSADEAPAPQPMPELTPAPTTAEVTPAPGPGSTPSPVPEPTPELTPTPEPTEPPPPEEPTPMPSLP